MVRTSTSPTPFVSARSFLRLSTSWTWKSLTSWPQETATVYGPGCDGFQSAQRLLRTLTVDPGKSA